MTFVILCKTPAEAEQALAIVQQWVSEAGLTLHPDKTQIVDSREQSFTFLGYVFRGRFRFPRAKSQQKFKDRVRELVQAHAQLVQTMETYQVESRMRENRTYGSAGGGVSQ